MQSKFIVAQFMETLYGPWAGSAVTVMILWAAFASVFALLLGYSRIPYAAALDGYFFKPFARLHPKGGFPHISLLVVGGLAALASFLELEWVLAALLTTRIRTRRREVSRPFKMWLYPLPSLIALVGWSYIFLTSGWTFILYGLLTLAGGLLAFSIWRRTSSETT